MDTEELARYLLNASQFVKDFSIPREDLKELVKVFTERLNNIEEASE